MLSLVRLSCHQSSTCIPTATPFPCTQHIRPPEKQAILGLFARVSSPSALGHAASAMRRSASTASKQAPVQARPQGEIHLPREPPA